MKKYIFIIFFTLLATMASSQGKWSTFTRPVTLEDLTSADVAVRDNELKFTPSVWLFRPAVAVTAMQFTWNKAEKRFDSSALASAGIGLSYSHFIEVDGKAYNNISVNALVLYSFDIGESVKTKLMPAVTATIYEYLNIGVAYDFALKLPIPLAGVKLSFN